MLFRSRGLSRGTMPMEMASGVRGFEAGKQLLLNRFADEQRAVEA